MRPIDDITALDPNDPVQAQEAIDLAVAATIDTIVADRRAAQVRANASTSRSASAVKLARGR